MPFLSTKDLEPDADASPDGVEHLGELDAVLRHFPDGRTAVGLMNDKILTQGILDPSVRALVAAAAAAKWSDSSQLAKHLGVFARERGVSVEDAQTMLADPESSALTAAEQALVGYINKASTEPFKMVPRDVEALTDQGWGERETVEALTVVCVVSYMAVANLALGVVKGSN